MTNLIAKVAELRELEARAEGIEYFSIGECELNYDTVEFLENMRIAAPRLLAALGKVQEGDAIAFQFLIDHVDIEDLERWSQCPNLFDLFSRYCDLARLMEDTIR